MPTHPTYPTYTNPVLDRDFADPSILAASDGWYYAYATQSPDGGRVTNVQVARSRDLIAWQPLPDALPAKPAWAQTTQDFWSPHVIERAGRCFMYYSAAPDARTGLAIAVAVAAHPAGPFVDSGAPLASGPGFTHIDPMAFDDPVSGQWLLYWGSGFAPLCVQELAPDRLHFLPGSTPRRVLAPRPDRPYEALIEGVWVHYRRGWYYLFYSGDNACGAEAHYAVLVARGRSPFGPFRPRRGRQGEVVVQAGGRWSGPGNNAIVTDGRNQDWICYHATDRGAYWLAESITGRPEVRRPMLLDRVTYRAGWPTVAGAIPSGGPTRAPVPHPAPLDTVTAMLA